MLLRMMRGRRTGSPSPVARLLALLVVVGLLAITAPVVGPPAVRTVRWLSSLL
ncbi:hypothetical protein GCM10027446_02700 [Angustibacter peucedani]